MSSDSVLAAAQARRRATRSRVGVAKPVLVPLRETVDGDDRDNRSYEDQADSRDTAAQGRFGALEDDAPDPRDPYQTHVPDGEYAVTYVKDERGSPFGRCVHFVHFVIFEPEEHRGKTLLRFINEPRQWKGKRGGSKARSLAHSSGLWEDFLAMTGRKTPNRVFALSELYRGALLRAVVVEVKERSNEGGRVEVPEAAPYSEIQRFLGQAAGPHSSFRGAPQL